MRSVVVPRPVNTVDGPSTWWRRALVEPRRPARVRESPNAHWLVVATVCVGAFLGQLDASIVILALPQIMSDYGVGLGAVEWVALSYLLVLVATVILLGRLGDIAGRKLLYAYGFGVFLLGSVACAVAPSLAWLIAARVAQAIGAAMLQANSVALITQAMPAAALGRGIGVQGAAQAMGLALGPVIGGLLIALGGWRLIFLVNIPIGIVGTILAFLLLPRSRTHAPREGFDWLGAGLLALGAGTAMAVLSLVRDGAAPVATLAALAVLAVLLCGAFVVRQRTAAAPLLPRSLFENRAFSIGIGGALVSYLGLFGTLLVVPVFLEHRGHASADVGLVVAALPVALGLMAPFAGRLSDRRGTAPVAAAGLVTATLGLAWLARGAGTLSTAGALAVVGLGFGAFVPANNAGVMRTAPAAALGAAGGMLNMTRGLGTALGVAIAALAYGAVDSGPAGLRRVCLVLGALMLACAAVLFALRRLIDRPPPAAPRGDAGRSPA
jgi:EmrB/QacA subfamily drug resistance transporter